MNNHTISASEVRDRFSDLLDSVETGRVLVTKHGQGKAYLISVRELQALEETLAITENQPLLDSISRGLADASAGRIEDANEVFAELDAEFTDEV